MAHTRLFSRLRRAFLLAREASRLGIPVREHAEERAEAWRTNRRRFLETAALAASAPLVASLPACRSHSDDEIAIVGGGIAGLACAYRLSQHGIGSRVYEHQGRTGGRMFSSRGAFKDGQVCEIGGELIDTGHTSIRNFAQELGITLDDSWADAGGTLLRDRYRIGGVDIDPATVITDFAGVAPLIDDAFNALTDPNAGVTYDAPNGGQALDQLSIAEWFDQNGVSGNIRRILEIAYEAEYGLPIDASNVFNLLFLITTNPGEFHVYGDSDERYHTHLGNDTIPHALAKRLGDRVELEHTLVRISSASSGRYRLDFDTGSGTRAVIAPRVVLALPFSKLRTVEIDIDLPPAKTLAIQRLKYGNNAKLMVGFDHRVWRDFGHDGQAITDLRCPETWEASRGQTGDSGIIVDYLSTTLADEVQYGSPVERAMDFARDFDQVYPGVAAAFNRRALRAHWPTTPWVLGSYSAWQAGDMTTFAGAEAQRVGNLHFAGEHTSLDSQGYMEGGAESGEAAAAEILTDLGVSTAAIAQSMTLGGFARRDFLAMLARGDRRRHRARR